jgi:hypothetical protein
VAQAVTKPVDAVERGKGVIHGRRQRPDRYLDELIRGKPDVLGERLVWADNVSAVKRFGHVASRVGRHHERDRLTLEHEVAGPATVITAAAMAMRIPLAESELPLVTHPGSDTAPLAASRSTLYVTAKSTTARRTIALGTTQTVVLIASRRAREMVKRSDQRPLRASLSFICGPAPLDVVLTLPARLPGAPRQAYATLSRC